MHHTKQYFEQSGYFGQHLTSSNGVAGQLKRGAHLNLAKQTIHVHGYLHLVGRYARGPRGVNIYIYKEGKPYIAQYREQIKKLLRAFYHEGIDLRWMSQRVSKADSAEPTYFGTDLPDVAVLKARIRELECDRDAWKHLAESAHEMLLQERSARAASVARSCGCVTVPVDGVSPHVQ